MTARERFAVAWRAVRLVTDGRSYSTIEIQLTAVAAGWPRTQAREILSREVFAQYATEDTAWARAHRSIEVALRAWRDVRRMAPYPRRLP